MDKFFSDINLTWSKWMSKRDDPTYRAILRPSGIGFGVFSVSTLATGRLGRSSMVTFLAMGSALFYGVAQNKWDETQAWNKARHGLRPLTEEDQYQMGMDMMKRSRDRQAKFDELKTSEVSDKMAQYVDRKINDESKKS